MPYHQSLIDAAEPHALVKQLTHDIEDYHQKFVALSFALGGVGQGLLLILGGRDYENFEAYVGNVRWDDAESRARREAALEPAVQAVTDAFAKMKATGDQVLLLPEHSRETYKAKTQRCAITIAEREHARMMKRVAEARKAIATPN
ncbi:MAG TPA: hypothetical protein V6D22_24210 [Candidatus Obscuribacterales bacterium]